MSPNEKKKKDSKIENACPAFSLEANQFSCQVAILQVHVAKDLNWGLPRTNSASRQGGNKYCTQSLLITILADWPLDHVASLWIDRLQVPVIKYDSE